MQIQKFPDFHSYRTQDHNIHGSFCLGAVYLGWKYSDLLARATQWRILHLCFGILMKVGYIWTMHSNFIRTRYDTVHLSFCRIIGQSIVEMPATQWLLQVETHIRQLAYHSIKISMKALVGFQHTVRDFVFAAIFLEVFPSRRRPKWTLNNVIYCFFY